MSPGLQGAHVKDDAHAEHIQQGHCPLSASVESTMYSGRQARAIPGVQLPIAGALSKVATALLAAGTIMSVQVDSLYSTWFSSGGPAMNCAQVATASQVLRKLDAR